MTSFKTSPRVLRIFKPSLYNTIWILSFSCMVAKVCILYTFGAYYFPDLGKYRLVSVLVYNGFSYRLFAPPGAFVLPKNFPPPIVNLTPLIAILAPPEAICTPNFFRVDRTLNCARYSRFFGIKTVNSGKCAPLRRRPSATRTLRTWALRHCSYISRAGA